MPRIRVSVTCLGERHSLVRFNNRLAIITQTLKRPGKGGRMARVKAVYLGFDSFDQAQAAASDLRRRFPKARLEVRQAERLATAFEVKFAHEVAEAICWEMLKQIETTGQRVSRHLATYIARPSLTPDGPALPRHTGRTLVGVGSRVVGID